MEAATFEDSYRDMHLHSRRLYIQQARLYARQKAAGPSSAWTFYAAQLEGLTRLIRDIEGWTGCRAWDGA